MMMNRRFSAMSGGGESSLPVYNSQQQQQQHSNHGNHGNHGSSDDTHFENWSDSIVYNHEGYNSSSSGWCNLKWSNGVTRTIWVMILIVTSLAFTCYDLQASSVSGSGLGAVSSSSRREEELERRQSRVEEEGSRNNSGVVGTAGTSWFPGATESSAEFYWQQQQQDQQAHTQQHLRPLVISGPSGVGKGTLIKYLLDHYGQDTFGFSVSETTRQPRPGELHGQHYYFTTRSNMEHEIQQGLFLEHAQVHDNLYGTSYESVNKVTASGRICILDIDIQGVKHIHENKEGKLSLPPHFVFVKPPSMELLEKRLRDRKTETEDAIQRRLTNAQAEIQYGTSHNNFDHIIVNDNLDTAFFHLRMILEEWYPHITLLHRIPSQ